MSTTVSARESARTELASFGDRLVGPEDDRYDEARTLFNAMIDRRPALIAYCASRDDVAAAIRFAREHDLTIAVRGGGHNGGGLGSVDEGVVIDLSPLKAVSVDPATAPYVSAAAASGARSTRRRGRTASPSRRDHLADRRRRSDARRRHGYLARRHGLTIDNLLSAEMVLADGSQVTASADRAPGPLLGDPRRRRQLRRRHRVHVPGAPARDRRRRADVLGDRGRERAPRGLPRVAALRAAQRDGLLQLPHDPTGRRGVPRGAPPAQGLRRRLGIDATDEEAEKAMAPLLSVAEPLIHGVRRMPIPSANGAFDGLYGPGDQWYWRGAFLREIPDEAIALNREWNERMPGFKAGTHFYPVDGAVNDVGGGSGDARGKVEALNERPSKPGFVTEAAGFVVSTTIAFWPPMLEAPPTAGRVRVALLVAASLIVPPASASELVAE